MISSFLVSSFIDEKEEQATYSNAEIPREMPDPSIILVGDTYYAAVTYNVICNARNLPSGICIAALRKNSTFLTKKMILLK